MRTPNYWTRGKAHIQTADSILGEVIRRYEDPPLRSKERPFETLCNAIVGQQVSAAAAAAIWGRASAIVGDWVPEKVRLASESSLRESGLSRRKVEYLKGVANHWDSLPHGDFDGFSDEQLRESLCALRGVGPWSANMLMLFSYLRQDIFPIRDIGVIRAMERLYDLPRNTDAKRLVAIASVWQPYRSVATWYLWRLIDSEPVLY